MNGQWVHAVVVLAAGLLAAGCKDAEVADPVPLFTETPVEYPVELWDANVEGVALVRVLVNLEGGVDSAMIAEGSGNAALDSAALRGAREMLFDPARRNGQPVRVWARVPVHFSKQEAGTGNPDPDGNANLDRNPDSGVTSGQGGRPVPDGRE